MIIDTPDYGDNETGSFTFFDCDEPIESEEDEIDEADLDGIMLSDLAFTINEGESDD